MKEDLQRVEAKVDKLDTRLDTVDQHLTKYNTLLDIHIKATKENTIGIQTNTQRIEQTERDVLGVKKDVKAIFSWPKMIYMTLVVISIIAGIIYRFI